MKKVLVVGASGLVGQALVKDLKTSESFEVYSTYFNNKHSNDRKAYKLDIEDLSDITEIITSVKPHIIVSSLRGDFNKQMDLHVFMADYLKRTGGSLYYCSTANVFDNDFSRAHYEEDLLNAKTDYGLFKCECEKTLTNILGDQLCIMRLPQVWGRNSRRVKELIEAIKENTEIVLYPKLEINTITDIELSRQIVYLIEKGVNNRVHFGSCDSVTHKDFYMQLISKMTDKKLCIKESFDETGIFLLLSHRSNEFPETFRFSTSDVIDYLNRLLEGRQDENSISRYRCTRSNG